MNLTPKDWTDFQHYKDRSPIWIKLHRKLLDNYDFSRLPVASRALAPMLWLLASEYDGGIITASLLEIAFRLRMTEGEVAEALNPLLEAKFFTSDSKPLAKRKPKASLEKRQRRDREEKRRATQLSDDFVPENTAAASVGLTTDEAKREFEKFKNYAKQNGRTCVNWQAAWSNWCIKAAEFLGRGPPPDPTKPTDVPGFYAPFGSEQLEAWDQTKPGGYPRDKHGGWRFPSEWPPEHERNAA
jgi:hypothetical protein